MNENNEKRVDVLKPAKSIYELVEMIVLADVVTIIVFMFLGRLTVVDGPSMNNTLAHGEVLQISARLPKEEISLCSSRPEVTLKILL